MRCLVCAVVFGLLLPLPAGAANCGGDQPGQNTAGHDVRDSRFVTVAVDRQDRLWRLWESEKHLYVDCSPDSGASFNTAVAVNAEPESFNAAAENRPRLGVYGEHLIVVWSRPGKKRFTSDLRISRSSDGGMTFSKPENLNRDGLGLETGHSFADLSVGPDGSILIAWLDGRDRHRAESAGEAFHGTSLYFTRAEGPDRPFAPERPAAAGSCECCRLALGGSADGRRFVLWRHLIDSRIRDHALGVWTDRGFGWQRASFENWDIEACPHHGPALAVADERIHAAWFSGAEQATGLFYRAFDADRVADAPNSGSIVDAPVMPFGDSERFPSRPALAVNGSVVVLVWLEYDGEQSLIRMRHSGNRGDDWSDARTVAKAPGPVDHPQLVTLDDRIVLSWQRKGTGHALIPLVSHQ